MTNITTTRFNKRMSDNDNIPEMNGTIKKLVELIASPIKTADDQRQAIRESLKLQLHTYMMQKQILEAVEALLDERKGILSRIIDKGIVPFLYFLTIAVLWIVFNTFKP